VECLNVGKLTLLSTDLTVDSNDITVLVLVEQKHYFHLLGLQKPLFSVVTRENNVFLLSFHCTCSNTTYFWQFQPPNMIFYAAKFCPFSVRQCKYLTNYFFLKFFCFALPPPHTFETFFLKILFKIGVYLSVTIMSPELRTTATRFGYRSWPSLLPHSPN
jgi:hypothetical protein